VSEYYYRCHLHDYARRVSLCSQFLEFHLVPNSESGILKLQLSSALFCRVRHCPICQWRRSLRWKAKAHQAFPKVIEDYPKHRWLFLTLTLKNCNIAELRHNLNHINRAFKRLTEIKKFPGLGWIKSLEVTKGKGNKTAHPHIHCLLMVKPSFFGKGYITKEEWLRLWQKCLRVEYQPILDIKAIKPNTSPITLLSEVLKYQTKESDLIADFEWFGEFVKQTHNTRAIAVGGILREYFKDLERPSHAHAESQSKNLEDIEEIALRFSWNQNKSQYELKL